MPDIIIAGDFFIDSGNMNHREPRFEFDKRLVEFIKSHQLSIVNFEATLGDELQPVMKSGPNLSSSVEAAKVALEIGFNAVSLGNNHSMDFGVEGLLSTLRFFEQHDIPVVGAGRCQSSASAPLEIQCKGKSISIFNFCHNEWGIAKPKTPGVSGLDLARNLKAVQKAKSETDFVVVICHMGHEYVRYQTPLVKGYLEAFADFGADVVVNHHPHVVGGKSQVGKSHVFSSIGNFCFTPHFMSETKDTQRGLLVSLTIRETGCLDIKNTVVHWDQSKESLGILDGEYLESWMKDFETTSAIFNDSEKTQAMLEQLVEDRVKEYSGRLEPRNNMVLRILRRLGLYNSMWPRSRRYALLNVIRCETHREILVHMLEEELSACRE